MKSLRGLFESHDDDGLAAIVLNTIRHPTTGFLTPIPTLNPSFGRAGQSWAVTGSAISYHSEARFSRL
jgi:hypothetical protein